MSWKPEDFLIAYRDDPSERRRTCRRGLGGEREHAKNIPKNIPGPVRRSASYVWIIVTSRVALALFFATVAMPLSVVRESRVTQAIDIAYCRAARAHWRPDMPIGARTVRKSRRVGIDSAARRG